MTEFIFLSVPMLLRSTVARENLGGGRRVCILAVPFVSRGGTDITSGAVSLISGSEKESSGSKWVVNKYLVSGAGESVLIPNF
jgi:hypothetical protein